MNQSRSHLQKRTSNHLVLIEITEVSQHVEPFTTEVPLYLTETCLNSIVFRTVTHIKYLHDVKLGIVWPHSLVLMDTELIHEECKWLVSIFLPQLLQIWDECVSLDGRSVDLDELHTTLS